ncbi:hypothetical protein DACRYDRAFT_44487 [Dacryopinax primogenitus]|uniref:Peptidase S54 rhomboid domain-containing protein n=1 Tax=Dacryopinax primogenitus (strain DJM 731) TaxID=1858805 RepID=M5G7V9_DACPD|nr:uncharacterized protein DACRYDRAFT_44487 [Dacryopinax primogenitus]EJU06291.1 hypothetical protein DACRYDRAFT_44487 [Dacryopinax primogenitus]
MSFHHAPVTEGIMIVCGVASLAAALFDIKYYMHLQLIPHLWRDHQYWRLFIYPLAFANSSDLLVAEYVLFFIGANIERTFGSDKFASFCFVTTVLSTLLSFASLVLFHNIGLNVIPSGPYALVFSIMYQYYRIVPTIYHYRVFGVSLSNKSVHYILPLQLFVGQSPGSAVAGTIGLLSGQLYRTDILGLKSYRLSPRIVRLSTRFILPLLGSLRPPRRGTSIGDEAPTRRTMSTAASVAAGLGIPTALRPPTQQANTPAAPGQQTPDTQPTTLRSIVQEIRGQGTPLGLRVPSEAEIAQVASMFPDARREDVIGALQRRLVMCT